LSENSVADDASHAQLTPAAPKPAHVPDALVYDFDYFKDPGLQTDPHGRIQQMHQEAPPVFWTPRQGGHWVALSYEANFDLGRDWETFSSEFVPQAQMQAMRAALPPGAPHIPQPLPINVDPPLHTKYRLPLNGAFSPKAMNLLRDDIRAMARELIANIAPKGRSEFMADVAEPLPVNVFLKMFGLPVERAEEYRALVKEHFAEIEFDTAATVRKLQKVAAIMHDTFLERKANPGDDLISRLWQANVDGQETTIEDMENWGVLLFLAGLDTVMNGIGLGVRHLATDPALQARVRNDPSLSQDLTEELLRRYTFTVPVRVTAQDKEWHGAPVRKGDRVLMLLGGADLDTSRFADPARTDIDREDKVHIAFGAGPHRCVGSHLARIELQILYEELLAGLPSFRLDPENPPKFHGGNVIGLDTLHLVWDV
jgi:cytochrome P450